MAEKEKNKKLKSELYSITSEGLNRKANFCPKCGAGVFMANHKNRLTCGKCGYTEMKTQK
jgi:small subunit ribosomal protein S27Ae